jgi:hypothetical protein
MADSRLRMSVIPRLKFQNSPTSNFSKRQPQVKEGKNPVWQVLRKKVSR